MKQHNALVLLLLLVSLVTFGCAGMSNYQPGRSEPSTMDSCNGDVPSPYPPYCRPVHD